MFYLVLLEICCFYDFQIECMQIRLVKFVTRLFNELRQNCHLANKISILVYVQFIIIQFWWRLKKVEILTITGKISVCVLCYWSFKVLSLVAFMFFFICLRSFFGTFKSCKIRWWWFGIFQLIVLHYNRLVFLTMFNLLKSWLSMLDHGLL